MYLWTESKSIKTRKKSLNLKNTPVFRTQGVSKKFILEIGNVFQLCHFTRVKISSTNSNILLRVPRIYRADLAFRRNNADQSVLANFYFESRGEWKQRSTEWTQDWENKVPSKGGGGRKYTRPLPCLPRLAHHILLTRAKWSVHAPSRRRPRWRLPKAKFKRRTFHVPNLIRSIKYMKTSTFESIKCDIHISNLGRPTWPTWEFRVWSDFVSNVELCPYRT